MMDDSNNDNVLFSKLGSQVVKSGEQPIFEKKDSYKNLTPKVHKTPKRVLFSADGYKLVNEVSDPWETEFEVQQPPFVGSKLRHSPPPRQTAVAVSKKSPEISKRKIEYGRRFLSRSNFAFDIAGNPIKSISPIPSQDIMNVNSETLVSDKLSVQKAIIASEDNIIQELFSIPQVEEPEIKITNVIEQEEILKSTSVDKLEQSKPNNPIKETMSANSEILVNDDSPVREETVISEDTIIPELETTPQVEKPEIIEVEEIQPTQSRFFCSNSSSDEEELSAPSQKKKQKKVKAKKTATKEDFVLSPSDSLQKAMASEIKALKVQVKTLQTTIFVQQKQLKKANDQLEKFVSEGVTQKVSRSVSTQTETLKEPIISSVMVVPKVKTDSLAAPAKANLPKVPKQKSTPKETVATTSKVVEVPAPNKIKGKLPPRGVTSLNLKKKEKVRRLSVPIETFGDDGITIPDPKDLKGKDQRAALIATLKLSTQERKKIVNRGVRDVKSEGVTDSFLAKLANNLVASRQTFKVAQPKIAVDLTKPKGLTPLIWETIKQQVPETMDGFEEKRTEKVLKKYKSLYFSIHSRLIAKWGKSEEVNPWISNSFVIWKTISKENVDVMFSKINEWRDMASSYPKDGKTDWMK